MVVLAPPDRSYGQRVAALNEANRIRSRRAQMKRDMRAGRSNPARLIIDPPEWMRTMKVLDLLLACPKIGRVKATRILRDLSVSPSVQVRHLSKTRRREIALLIGGPR